MTTSPTPPLPNPKPSRPGTAWVWLLVLTVAGAVVGFLCGAVLAYVSPKKFESVTVAQLHQEEPGGQDWKTLLAIMGSAANLELVEERLDLSSRWAMDPAAVVGVLKESVTMDVLDGTDLVEIRVRHTNPETARDVAAAIVEVHAMRQAQQLQEKAERVLDVLRDEVHQQEDVVEERRKILQIVREREDEGLEDASKDHEAAVAMLDHLKRRLASERIAAKIPTQALTIHEEARVGRAPVSPNVTTFLLTGLLAGLGGGLLLGVLVFLLTGKRNA